MQSDVIWFVAQHVLIMNSSHFGHKQRYYLNAPTGTCGDGDMPQLPSDLRVLTQLIGITLVSFGCEDLCHHMMVPPFPRAWSEPLSPWAFRDFSLGHSISPPQGTGQEWGACHSCPP